MGKVFFVGEALGPSRGVEIRCVLDMSSPPSRHRDKGESEEGTLNQQPGTMRFWISAKAGSAGDSRGLSQRTAGLLRAVLDNPQHTTDLAQKGIHHVRARMGVLPISEDYSRRLVSASFEVSYTTQY